MSIILAPGHIEIAESEFIGRHPDTLGTYLAAKLVYRIARQIYLQNSELLEDFRADVNVQISALNSINTNIKPLPVRISLVGQIMPKIERANLDRIVEECILEVFAEAGYFLHGDFAPEQIVADTHVTLQSPDLNEITQNNSFADHCTAYGHYVKEPFGIKGTFPSLAIAKEIDKTLEAIVIRGDVPGLRPDGKVTVYVVRESNGYRVRDVEVTIAHGVDVSSGFREALREIVSKAIVRYNGGQDAQITVNGGGDFKHYLVAADYGVSGKKDHVIITGGIHELGTDGFWGKCLYKASSIAVPYAFALSRAVSEILDATFASVKVDTRHGRESELILQEIDPKYEGLRNDIDRALLTLPRDRDGIRDILDMKTNIVTYAQFNDVKGFHEPTKPWKAYNPQLVEALTRALRNS